ncbi:MAG: hypothetical protein LBP92_07845 [Deltaproteobacteria bacterium]|jgi:hypothetical protein|nr:hypothetical protein [Deltaproteobacteria bacterium]
MANGFLDEDLRSILGDQVFGEAFTFDPGGPAETHGRGIFGAAVGERPAGPLKAQGVTVECSLMVAESVLPRRPLKEDLFQVRSKAWRASRIFPDGQGMVTVMLFEVRT